MVLMKSVDEAYFVEATAETNPLARNIYKEMILPKASALVKDLEEAQQMMFQADNRILFASETVVSFRVRICS